MLSDLQRDATEFTASFHRLLESGIEEGVARVAEVIERLRKLIEDTEKAIESHRTDLSKLARFYKDLATRFIYFPTLWRFFHSLSKFLEALAKRRINDVWHYGMLLSQSVFAPIFERIAERVLGGDIGRFVALNMKMIGIVSKILRWIEQNIGIGTAYNLLKVVTVHPIYSFLTNVVVFLAPAKFVERYERFLKIASSLGAPKELLEEGKRILEELKKFKPKEEKVPVGAKHGR